MDQSNSRKNQLSPLRGKDQASETEPGSAKTVTRADLLDVVYMVCPTLSRAQARDVFELTLDEIVEALLRGEPVRLRAFGAFSVRAKRERVGRNPRTGVEAKIDARRVLTFKPSPTLNARINHLAPVETDCD